MADIGHIPLVQCQSNADLASSITWGHFHNIVYARIFMKADCFRCERRPCCHLPPGGSWWSHSPYVWPFCAFTKLTYAIRPLSPCHHVCSTTMCNWITWNLSDLGVSVYVGGAEIVVGVGLSHFVVAADERSAQNVSIPRWLQIKTSYDISTVGTHFLQSICSAVTTLRDFGSSGMLHSADW